MVLDLALRFRVHALMLSCEALSAAAASSTSRPGIRSLQVHFDAAIAAQARAARRARATPRTRLPATRRSRGPDARSCTCRCRGTTRRRAQAIERYMQAVRADAPWCPWNIEFIRRINGLGRRRRRAAHRVRRRVSRAGPGRRLPRRAGRHAARPAPPAGHHQVQPGPHLDARERGRHRRRLPVHLRHGGAGRLPVRRAHRAGVEPLSADRGLREGSRGCCASSTSIRFYPVSARGAHRAGGATSRSAGATSRSSRRRSGSRTTARSSPTNATASTPSRRAARPPSTPSAPTGTAAASSPASRPCRRSADAPTPTGVVAPDGCGAGRSAAGGSVWKMHVGPATASSRGASSLVIEAMKTEMRRGQPGGAASSGVYARENQPVAPARPDRRARLGAWPMLGRSSAWRSRRAAADAPRSGRVAEEP